MDKKLSRLEFLRYITTAIAVSLLTACRRALGIDTETIPAVSTVPPLTATKTPDNTFTTDPSDTATPEPIKTEIPPQTATTNPTKTFIHLLTPADGSRLPGIGRITFSWETYSSASSYRLIITAPTGKTISFATVLPKHDRYIETLPWGGEFGWQVSALDKNGNSLCTSEIWVFNKPNPPAFSEPDKTAKSEEDQENEEENGEDNSENDTSGETSGGDETTSSNTWSSGSQG